MSIKKPLTLAAIMLAFFVINQATAESSIKITADNYLQQYTTSEMKFIAESNDNLNQTHIRYNQQYHGVPVFGGQSIVHLKSDLSLNLITGKTLPHVSINTTPSISSEEAINTAMQSWNDEYKNIATDSQVATLYIFNPYLFTGKNTDNKTSLVYEVELYKDHPSYHKFYFIDAQTNQLIYTIEGIQSSINRNILDCSGGVIVSYWGADCYLEQLDTVYWTGFTFGRSEGKPARGTNPFVPYIPTTTTPHTHVTDTDIMYDYFGYAYNYYFTKYGRDGANYYGGMGDGSTEAFQDLNGVSHSFSYPVNTTTGFSYIDTFYIAGEDQYCPNAMFNGKNSIHFCAGVAGDDVIGHEYGHAVNYFSIVDANGNPSGQIYSGETGAMNEGNSDIFGEALQLYVSGTADWVHGASTESGASRSMQDPSRYTYTLDSATRPYPESYNDANFYCGTGDNGGNHINMTVYSYTAYLMSQGGTVKGCTITGIGSDKEEAILYRAETTYYTPATGFNAAYPAILQACYDLYGAGSTDCNNVKKSLTVTEMNGTGKCNGGTSAADFTAVCAAIDAAPTIASITSDTADGYYSTGAMIDVDVNFSEAVTSAGDITLTFNTGKTCVMAVSNATTGICTYTVQAGDNAADFNVASVSGSITDNDGSVMANFTPGANLADSKTLVIDTAKPGYPRYLKIYTAKNKKHLIASINTKTYTKIIRSESLTPYFVWKAANDNLSGINGYYVRLSTKEQKRLAVKKNKYYRTGATFKGEIWDMAKTHYLQIIAKDNAGNMSKFKTLMRYQVEE